MFFLSREPLRFSTITFIGVAIAGLSIACTSRPRRGPNDAANTSNATAAHGQSLTVRPRDQDRLPAIETLTEETVARFARLGFTLDPTKFDVALVTPEQFVFGIRDNARYFELPGFYDALGVTARMFGATLGRSAEELRTLAPLAINEVTSAYYDIGNKTLTIRDDPETRAQSLQDVVAHELGHAYRDQLPGGIEGYVALHRGSVDELRAAHSSLEGEATLFSEAVRLAKRGLGIEILNPNLMDPTVSRLSNGEAYSLVYDAGRRFLLSRFAKDGMKAVVDAVSHPPTSTEQLLHPEKLGRDLPSSVTLPPLTDEFRDSSIVFEGTLGELVIYFRLLHITKDLHRARLAATGWDGDRLRVFKRPKGGYGAVWQIRWDRELDGAQFCELVVPLLKELPQSQIACHGAVTELFYADTPDEAAALKRGFTTITAITTADPFDSVSTATAENEYVRIERLRPRLQQTRWDWPALGLSFEIPTGFFPLTIRGVDLLTMLPVEGFANNITVTYEQDLYPGEFDQYVERQKDALRASGHTWLRDYPVNVAGQPSTIIETRVSHEQDEAYAVFLVIPRNNGTLLTVTIATGNGKLALARKLVQFLAHNLELREAQL
jgi:hypothetical protein